MQNLSRCKEKTEGRLGRRRAYACRECNVTFTTEERLSPLPEIDRVCPACRQRTYVYTFVDKTTGRETKVRASSAELATLRALEINLNLTFKTDSATKP